MKWQMGGNDYEVDIEKIEGLRKISSTLYPDQGRIVIRMPTGLNACCEEENLGRIRSGLEKRLASPPRQGNRKNFRIYRDGEQMVLLEKPFALRMTEWDGKGVSFQLDKEAGTIMVECERRADPSILQPVVSKIIRRGIAEHFQDYLQERTHALYHKYIGHEEPYVHLICDSSQRQWVRIYQGGRCRIPLRAVQLSKDQVGGLILDAFRQQKLEPKLAPLPNVIDSILREIADRKGLKL